VLASLAVQSMSLSWTENVDEALSREIGFSDEKHGRHGGETRAEDDRQHPVGRRAGGAAFRAVLPRALPAAAD
jgi:hypothetical protein